MQIPAAKEFEKPEAGPHLGVIVDVVDLGVVTSVFNGQAKTYPAIRFIWALGTVGKDGKQLLVWGKKLNASSWHENGNLYKTVKQILGQPPAVTFDPESLIGQVRHLFISREKSVDGTKDYVNIVGITPAQPGTAVATPTDYVRVKFRPKTQAGPQGQPVQTFQQPLPGQPVAQAQAQYVPPQTQPVQQQPPYQPVQGATVKF